MITRTHVRNKEKNQSPRLYIQCVAGPTFNSLDSRKQFVKDIVVVFAEAEAFPIEKMTKLHPFLYGCWI